MKLTKLFYMTVIAMAATFAISHVIFAHHTTDGKYEYKQCYDTPIPGGAANPNMATIKKDVLDPIGVPTSIKVQGVTQNINIPYLYKRHIVVYGTPFLDFDSTKTICGMQVRRYMGYTQQGVPMHELDFPEDVGGSPDYIQDRELVRFPWNNTSLVAGYNAVSKNGTVQTKYPQPKKDNLYSTNAERIADLDKVIDSFSPTKNNTHGYFLEKHKHWCENSSGKLYFSSNCGSNGAVLTGKHLQDFAIILQKSTDYSPGVIALYIDNGCNLNGFCYSIHVIPQDKDPFVAQNDASVALTLNKTKFTDEKITGKITIKNDWSTKAPQTIASPCDATKNVKKAQCKTGHKYGGITVTSKSDSQKIYNESFTFPEVAQGKSIILDLAKYNIEPPRSGEYEISVWIPHYVDNNAHTETTYVNNTIKKTFNMVVNQNAIVQTNGQGSYTVGDKLTNKVIVKNETKNPLSGPLTISLVNKEGKNVKTITKSFANIPVNGTYSFDLSNENIKLDAGDYKLQAKIKNYTDLPETNYKDNVSELLLKVNPYIPENTKCDKLNTQYTHVIPYPGVEPGITKTCIGWTPKFPSTRIEGGQGTYFYVAYKLFPSPMPAYKVTTLDDRGINQVFEHVEPKNALGACDMKVANDPKCDMYEPFFYYPAKWEDRFATAEYKDFVGPYLVGPHDFHHYRYRGRMMPSTVNFHFSIIDMKDNANIPLANGSVVYDIPEECYEVGTIDIKSECRLIQFYIPTEGKTNYKLPEDTSSLVVPKKKIEFLNPGEHRFTLEIEEKQKYFYQTDEGAEWQGKDEVIRKPWKTENPAAPNEKWVEIHKYDEGVFKSASFNATTGVGDGNWCHMQVGCLDKEGHSKMTPTVNYSKDGYTGILKELDYPEYHYAVENPSKFKYYTSRMMILNEDETFGYDYYQRGIYKQKDGSVKFTEWKNYNQRPGSQFVWWSSIPSGEFIGYEWQRYQIVGGMVKKALSDGGAESGTDMSTYPTGPVKTHTLKGSKPVEWVIQDEFENQCYSDTDAFGNTGTWKDSTFIEKDDKSTTCQHNHNSDFHYWKYDWSEVKKFGKDGFIH